MIKWRKPEIICGDRKMIKSSCGFFIIVKQNAYYNSKKSKGSIWESLGFFDTLDEAKDAFKS